MKDRTLKPPNLGWSHIETRSKTKTMPIMSSYPVICSRVVHKAPRKVKAGGFYVRENSIQ